MFVSIGGGQRLFVDVRGQADAPALLYVHGGPGQGSYEFMAAQGQRLARTFRVIGFDQRGVLRSDPLPSNASLSLDQLATDCDLLRRELDIERWTVLAHSIGALTAIRYAVAHPERVSRLILECPCLDIGDTSSNLLARAASLLRDRRRDNLADAALRAQDISQPAERWTALKRIWGELDDAHPALYFRRPEAALWFDEIWSQTLITAGERQRGGAHAVALQGDPAFFLPTMPLLTRIAQPSLLIKGAYDPVCTGSQVQAFRDHVADNRVVILAESGHFPQIEQPDDYAERVISFAGIA